MEKTNKSIDGAIQQFERHYLELPVTQLMALSKELCNTFYIKKYFKQEYDVILSAIQSGKIKYTFQQYCLKHFYF